MPTVTEIKESKPPELPKLIINVKLWCPHCGARHVDEDRNGEKWHRRAHTTHRCQSCGGDFDVFVSGQRPSDDVANLLDRLTSEIRAIEPDLKVDSRAWVPLGDGTVTTLSDWFQRVIKEYRSK